MLQGHRKDSSLVITGGRDYWRDEQIMDLARRRRSNAIWENYDLLPVGVDT